MITLDQARERLYEAENTVMHYTSCLQDMREETGYPLEHTENLLLGTGQRIADAHFLITENDLETAEKDILLAESGLRQVWSLLSMMEACVKDPDIAEAFGVSAEIDLACLNKKLMMSSGNGIPKDVELEYERMGWRSYLGHSDEEEWWTY